MTLNDIEEKLKKLAPSIEVPKELAGRVISAVSEHALRKQRRILIWQYLGHGFTSVIVFYFGINWIAPDVASRNMVIAGAIILGMLWLLFKVSGVAQKQHFGRIALSAATFGFAIATTGLLTLSPGTGIITPEDEELNILPAMPDVIEQASDESNDLGNIVAPMEEEVAIDDYEGDGYFGNVIKITEGDEYVFVTIKLDSGEELTNPVPTELYYKSALADLIVGDRVYIENKIIHPLKEKKNLNQNKTQDVFMES